MTLGAVRSKLFVLGGVNGTSQLHTLDTGLEGYGEAAKVAVARRLGEEAAEAANAAAAAEEEEERQKAKRAANDADQSRGLDATAAAELVALLQGLGMNKYARIFLRQEVDVDSLVHLSDTDLKDMGVAALGARRKLLAAIHRHRLKRLHAAEGRQVDDSVETDFLFRERASR